MDDNSYLESLWLPFTDNKAYKKRPKLIKSASGMYYITQDNRKVLDGVAGLWCVNAGHQRQEIVEAIKKQADIMTYCKPFQAAHEDRFILAQKLVDIAPNGLNRVFFTSGGSESVDTALKMALAYFSIQGKTSKKMLIGREKSYHGVCFGGMSVGGLANNQKHFQLLPNVAHLPHTHNPNKPFIKGQGEFDTSFADKLEDIVKTQGSDNVAAVIIEPIAGAGGVLVPPKGYLKKIREICDKYDILLVFDEVITAFGRIGDSFAAKHWGVIPDLITIAKGLTNGAIPMGGVLVKDKIYQTFIQNSDTIEFFHGYTYSGHP